MNLVSRLKMAKQKGEAVVRDLGIDALPIDPFRIAIDHDIVVEPKPDAESGVSGMLLRHGDAFGILYATHVPSEGFQRFSIAHELGHYFLDGHIDHVLPSDGIHTSHAGFVSADPYELEADNFAAGLLMPSWLMRRFLSKNEPGLAAIETIADTCRTSLTATAIRYVELTEDAVGVVLSTGSTIDYCFLSDLMKSLPDVSWLKKGSPVPRGTATLELNRNAKRIAQADRGEANIDIMDWLGGSRSVEATEEVIGLGRYGRTLTVLSCPSLIEEAYQEDEGEDDEDLVDRWTPRFRR